MMDRHGIVGIGVGIVRCGHRYYLRCSPVGWGEGQRRRGDRNLRVRWHLHGHGYVCCWLRGQHYRIARTAALANRQGRRHYGHAAHIVVDDRHSRAGRIAYLIGCAAGDRRRHRTIRLYVPVIFCCYQQRCCSCIRRECCFGGDLVREERTVLCYLYQYCQRRS